MVQKAHFWKLLRHKYLVTILQVNCACLTDKISMIHSRRFMF